MFSGPFEIAHATPGKGDGLVYTTLRFGYDTAAAALRDCKAVATEHGVPLDDIVVLRTTFYRDVAASKRTAKASPAKKAPKKAVAKKRR